MKIWFRTTICAMAVVSALALSLSPASRAQTNDNDGCKLSTLQGDYALRISGQIFNPSGAVVSQRDGIVMQHYDGAGGLTQKDYVLSNGVAVPGPVDPTTMFHTDESGTYTVNSDCTGTATVTFHASGVVLEVMFVLSNHGHTIHQIVSSLTVPNPAGGQLAMHVNIHADGEKLGLVGQD
ncbi:MAG TPA: hypothetical protein VJN93_12450 [Candidatus Acidoferrum sp.]|nr:hypothetical protein [Candidatus Acidoferrum sp.]